MLFQLTHGFAFSNDYRKWLVRSNETEFTTASQAPAGTEVWKSTHTVAF